MTYLLSIRPRCRCPIHLSPVTRLAVSARQLPLEQRATLAVPGARPHPQLHDA